ncbi:hypothetical protein GCM10028783_07880 [Modestobacter muralis]
MEEASARITVRRPKAVYRDRLRSYRVQIDGAEVGSLACGEELVLPVVPGTYRVRAVLDWSGSPMVDVDVAAGETVTLRVEPAGSAVAATFTAPRRDNWLHLSPE